MQSLIKKVVSLDVLIVEDEKDIAELIADILQNAGFSARIASCSREAFAEMQIRIPNAIILDLWLKGSDLDGLGILEKIKSSYSLLPVVVISGHGTIETAISAIKLGAYDYIAKPLSQEKLLITLKRACEASRLKKENIGLRSQIKKANELIGQSSIISRLRGEIQKVAASNSRVLIRAAFGCEQDIVANMIHLGSSRAARPMITVNPHLLDQQKLEGNLFGSLERNNKDALGRKIGLLEAAHGSVLYLQDVTFFALDMQKQLLNFIQNPKLPHTGEILDVRVISSTTEDIENLVKQGLFLADLYERLNIVQIRVPLLSERREDIPTLANHYLSKIILSHGLRKISFTDEAICLLKNWEWSANLKELNNLVEYCVFIAQSQGSKFITDDILYKQAQKHDQTMASGNPFSQLGLMNFRDAKKSFENYYIALQLNKFSNNISKTSDFIGMERSALHRKMRSLTLNIKE
jgi:two-component system, NtrC family, nitrogen regulation response regulator NtrX